VLDGGNNKFPASTCVTNLEATTRINGEIIAAQCCAPSVTGDNRCRRFVGSNTDAGCIAGMPPRPLTFVQAEATCAAHGLELCDRRCSGKGCWYNNNPARLREWNSQPPARGHPS
jgi:hypothetical protein